MEKMEGSHKLKCCVMKSPHRTENSHTTNKKTDIIDTKKLNTLLGDIRRKEQYEKLITLPDRELCEMIRAHFESHSTMPSEKVLRDRANQILSSASAAVKNSISEKDMNEMVSQYMGDDKEFLARGYAQTRIRETPVMDSDLSLINSLCLKRELVRVVKTENSVIDIDRIRAKLQNNGTDVDVLVKMEVRDEFKLFGKLPEKFLANNPMSVESCDAELQLIDYSNGKLKNISMKLVVDTDLMSGDVLDLSADVLNRLEQNSGIEQ